MVVPNGPLPARVDVDVDPLVVERGVGEGVDPGLVDVEPLAGADLGPGGRGDLVERGEGAHAHEPIVLDRVEPAWMGPMTTPTRDQVQAAPKVLLHDHLDGGLRPQTIVELAARGRPRAAGHRRRVARRWFAESADSGSLVRYLETFDHTVAVMQTGPAIARVARECVEDLAADGVVYAEVRYAPEQHVADGLTLDEVVAAVQEGFDAGMAAGGGRIVVRQLLTAMRHQARSMEIAELAIAWRDRGVAGFDIAGAEAGFPPTRHLDAFEYLQRENAHFTIHAGEAFGLPSIWEAIQWCGADRLGHGVRIIDDITVARRRVGRAGPAGGLRPRQADPARDVPELQHPDRGGGVRRRAPDRAADRPALPRHRQHRQPADERHLDDRRRCSAWWRRSTTRWRTCAGSPSTR